MHPSGFVLVARKKALALCIKSTTADEFGSNGSGGDAAAATSALPTQVATTSIRLQLRNGLNFNLQ